MKLTEIENGIWRLRAGTPEEQTPVSMRKFSVKSDALAAMEKRDLPELVDGLQYRQTKRGLVITLPMDSDEDIYGLGLQLKSVNQAGRKRMLRVNSDPVSDTGEGHAPVPFYVSTAGYGLFIDTFRHVEIYFGTNEAVKLFASHHRDKFVKNGVAGFKLDECDNSDLNPSNWSFPDTARFPSGLDGEQMHAALGTLYQGLIYDVYRAEDRRTLSQVRSSGALASPLPFVLYSDLYGHRDFIRGVVTSGFSGLLWPPEVRDCRNVPDLLRRMETVMFSAQALYNAWRIPSPPWKQTDIEKNLAGEPMEDTQAVTDIIRRYHEVRMSLLPYLYAAFSEYRDTGLPPVRALVMDFEDDLNVRNIDDEYMLGPDLLVAPLTLEDGTSRTVYLPAGTWYDFWDGAPFEGGRTIEFEVPYDKIPVFVRDGAVLPLVDPIQCVTLNTVFTVRPKIYGDGHRGCTLAEDDFTTFAYEHVPQRPIRLTVSNGKITTEPAESEKYRFSAKDVISLSLCS